MNFTVRFCHLEKLPTFIPGSIIKRGDCIGRMGNTGASLGAHLHIDCVRETHPEIYRLLDMDFIKIYPDIQQLNHFIDSELFDTEILITSYFYDPDYRRATGKNHPAYDVVPKNRKKTKKNYDIFWNRSKVGHVLSKGFDSGYGYYINVQYSI